MYIFETQYCMMLDCIPNISWYLLHDCEVYVIYLTVLA